MPLRRPFRWRTDNRTRLGAGRTSGEPGSANGASSFHLRWLIDGDEPLSEVSAVLEVVEPPAVDRLYFWALQVSFDGAGGEAGGAHIGLQWNRSHPGSRAVNWGGYGAGGRVLSGTTSPLPSQPRDPNTRDYPWQPHRPYLLRVHGAPGAAGAWRGEVTDLVTGEATVIRDLAGGGEHLARPLVWSEVFARCDHPSVTVRWSRLQAVGPDGTERVPRAVAVSYEPTAAGGCDNTTVQDAGAGALLQITNTPRLVPAGAVLPLPPR
ncbi:MAG TPA: hypothetical protein VNA57_14045 [Acidimicrobiales bacterium]|nr:hypothetical protein [Acidimicrobiales bacterium]